MLLHVCHFLHHLPTFWQFTDYRDTRAYILDPCIQEFFIGIAIGIQFLVWLFHLLKIIVFVNQILLKLFPLNCHIFLQLELFNYFGESLIAKINILLDCLFYVTQEKVSHWFCYWWFHQKCDTFSWNFSNVIRCYLFDRRMPNLVMVPITHCIPLFCLWWDYRLKRTFCPILLFNNDFDDHEDTFIADLKMDSFDKRPPKEYCNVFSNRLSTLKFHQFLTHVERNTWHISVWKKTFKLWI